MKADEVANAPAALGYDRKWWQYGLVDEPTLVAQLARFRAGGDPNTEHYRYGSFLHILATRPALNDVILAHFVELAGLDSDETMAQSALISLVRWPKLTEEQRKWLREQQALAAPVVQRAFARTMRPAQ